MAVKKRISFDREGAFEPVLPQVKAATFYSPQIESYGERCLSKHSGLRSADD
ncbi:MAG: hypothetical protein KDN22_16135 [Verrucomicrobiae bacterium]|nr:hypothetical protein [Verrucomicrobiae bacterium]